MLCPLQITARVFPLVMNMIDPRLENLQSRWWRLNNHYSIIDKHGNKITFRPNWAQVMFLENMWYCNILLKARQLGLTTFICIFFLDIAIFNSNTSCGIIAHNKEDAEKFFRNKIKVPSTLNPLESTSETKFYNPDYLFSGSQPVVMSNGLSYVISSWQIPDTVSWFKPIRIEAENSFGRTVSNLGTSVNSGLGTGMTVSNNYYLVLRDAALSQLSRLYVTYSIPGTLSARYNIYCTFVPKSILDPNDKKPYQVKFYLTYTNSSGQQVANAAIGAANNVLKPSDPAAVFTTDPTKIHKMLVVKDFAFPYSNAVFSANTVTELIKQIKVSLRIESVNTKEKDDILIDCIILEPVLQ